MINSQSIQPIFRRSCIFLRSSTNVKPCASHQDQINFVAQRGLVASSTLRGPKAPAKGSAVKVVGEKEDKAFIEMDAEKLTKYACINYLVDAETPGPEIKPDSEYPEWLFKMDLSAPRDLEDLDPEKDGWLYWQKLRRRQWEQNKRLEELKTSSIYLQDSKVLRNFKLRQLNVIKS
uniref:Large ribosomal subunit protein mL54 n=1 Tax=Plectus sambesii TaxID=2011161 RepID=A0A914XJM3_9BILA